MLKIKIVVENEAPATVIYSLKYSYIQNTFLRSYEENALEILPGAHMQSV